MFLSKFSPKFGWQKNGTANVVPGKSSIFFVKYSPVIPADAQELIDVSVKISQKIGAAGAVSGKSFFCKIFTSAHWASTGGQVAYFKKKYIFFLNFPCFIPSFNITFQIKLDSKEALSCCCSFNITFQIKLDSKEALSC